MILHRVYTSNHHYPDDYTVSLDSSVARALELHGVIKRESTETVAKVVTVHFYRKA